MKIKKTLSAAGLVVAVVCAVVILAIVKNLELAQEIAQPKVEPKVALLPQAKTAAAPTGSAPVEKNAASSEAQPAKTKPQQPVSPANAGQANGIGDPVAREALSYVGTDPDADEYWISAINNAELSADERQNLIEDLNEDGLSDPQNLSAEDLPLIVNRLQIIEELAPNAMDDVNAA